MTDIAADLGIISEVSVTDNEPRQIFSKNGRKEIFDYKDQDLIDDILFPIRRLIDLADDLQGTNGEEFFNLLNKASSLYSDDFSKVKQESMLDKHFVDSIRVQKIFTLDVFALVLAKIKDHRGNEFKRTYKLVKGADGVYLFHKSYHDGELSPDCLKSMYVRETVSLA